MSSSVTPGLRRVLGHYERTSGGGRVRGTGIGSFFDDPVHGLLGLEPVQFRGLYHFNEGYPVEDTRLTTRCAYPGLQRHHPVRPC